MIHKLTIIFNAIFFRVNEIEHSITQFSTPDLKTMLLGVESVNQTVVIATLYKRIITMHQQRHCFACIIENYRS